MAMLTKIRNNLGKAFAAFAVVFCVYILLDWGMDLGGNTMGGMADAIGVVNGKKISFKDFSEALRRASESYRTQNSVDPDEDVERQLRIQVWNESVVEKLIETEIERLGIDVSDREIIDIVHGQDPPEFLVSQFRDSLGRFNRQAYDRAIADPQNAPAWLQVEHIIREQRKREKLQSLVTASVRVSESEIRNTFLEKSTTLDVDYLLFDPAVFVSDSAASLTDSDLKSFYADHKEEFKTKATRALKYVFFSHQPLSEDTAAIINEFARLREQMTAGMDFETVAKTHSETPFAEKWVKHGELSRQKENAVFSAKSGTIVGPVFDFEGAHLIKVYDRRKAKDGEEMIRASHILIRAEALDTAAAYAKINDILRQIRAGANFAEMAKQHSEDGSAAEGGDLGYNRKGSWVKPFEDAAWKAPIGRVVGPIRTQFGYHLIKVTDRNADEANIGVLTLKLRAGNETIDKANQAAQDFAFLAKRDGFDKSAKELNYEVKETAEFQDDAYIPAIGVNDIVQNFAFQNDIGDISEPLSVSGGVAVFIVDKARVEGVLPYDEVVDRIRPQALLEKKLAMLEPLVQSTRSSLKADNFFAPAESDKRVIARATGPFKASEFIPGIGKDPQFVGAAFGLSPGTISKAVRGMRGYYILMLKNISPFDTAAFAIERPAMREQILQEKRSRVLNDWITTLREHATIEDNRFRFYR